MIAQRSFSVKVDISNIREVFPAKFPDNPRFTDLPGSFQDVLMSTILWTSFCDMSTFLWTISRISFFANTNFVNSL